MISDWQTFYSASFHALFHTINLMNHAHCLHFAMFSISIFINTIRPRQNCLHFADDIFTYIFFNENVWNSIKTSLKFVPKFKINNIPELVQIMARHQPGHKSLSEPMMVNLLMHMIYASLGLNALLRTVRPIEYALTLLCCERNWNWVKKYRFHNTISQKGLESDSIYRFCLTSIENLILQISQSKIVSSPQWDFFYW